MEFVNEKVNLQELVKLVGEELAQKLVDSIRSELFKEKQLLSKEWLTLKEAAEYIGVSPNTLAKFRLMGLEVCEVDGVKRISKSDIDRFMKEHSF
ncbi:helix-turn-helix domain-containing protein [Metasolibacillus sp. FSL H7-0170]|uniref:helix-turn-helix domain-containing protein n=1 Tax=Metasolibacillus sp. FSL H7-0170 TaxID=2921431 RepID=UPI003159028C